MNQERQMNDIEDTPRRESGTRVNLNKEHLKDSLDRLRSEIASIQSEIARLQAALSVFTAKARARE